MVAEKGRKKMKENGKGGSNGETAALSVLPTSSDCKFVQTEAYIGAQCI